MLPYCFSATRSQRGGSVVALTPKGSSPIKTAPGGTPTSPFPESAVVSVEPSGGQASSLQKLQSLGSERPSGQISRFPETICKRGLSLDRKVTGRIQRSWCDCWCSFHSTGSVSSKKLESWASCRNSFPHPAPRRYQCPYHKGRQKPRNPTLDHSHAANKDEDRPQD